MSSLSGVRMDQFTGCLVLVVFDFKAAKDVYGVCMRCYVVFQATKRILKEPIPC